MKKVLSIILTLVLVLSMSVTAFAAESGDIKVTYSQPNPEKVTIVDLTWGSMEFNYNSGDKKVWNPEKLEYEIVEGEEGDVSWTPANEGGDTVTVTNHSNTGLLVTVSYTPAAENGVTGSVENNSFLLATAEGTAADNAPKGSATLVLDNTSVPASWNKNGATTIGNITVKLDHCDVQTSTAEEFEAALANGGTIMLTEDIALTSTVDVKKNNTIALNGHTLTPGGLGLNVEEGCTLTVIGDGAVNGDEGLWVFDGTLNLQGGTVDWLNVCETSSTANISDGKVIILTVINDSTTNISGGYVGELQHHSGTLIITGGTFGFDPSDYVDTTNYTVTEADGIWTVTKN